MPVIKLQAGLAHRATRKLGLRLRDYDVLRVEHRDLLVGEVFQPWVPMEHWRGDEVPISLGDLGKEFDWGRTSDTGHFLQWDEFFEHCELAGTAAADGRVMADARADGLRFLLTGRREDIDAGLKSRSGRSVLPLGDAILLCQVLATGERRTLDRESGGRTWHLEWTLEDPRSEFDRQPASLAEQLLWFFPGGEDWTVLRMSCAGLVHGLGVEVGWLLRAAELSPGDRSQLEAMLVSLDQAMVRCGI